MQERRKYQRYPIKLELMISSLFKQDYEIIPDINENIEIKNIIILYLLLPQLLRRQYHILPGIS
jgi:hypothetical protein